MSGEMVSRWPVVVSRAVDPSDCSDDGRLTEPSVERLFAEARSAYFEECRSVDAASIEVLSTKAQTGDAAVGDEVTISVSVVEVYPDSFTMTARVRPADREGIAATAWCSLSPGGDVPTAMRDEFIALAHAARHFH